MRGVQVGCRLEGGQGLGGHPHAVEFARAPGAPASRLGGGSSRTAARLGSPPVPLDRAGIVGGGGGGGSSIASRAAAPCRRPVSVPALFPLRPRQRIAPPMVHAGALERMRGVQLGGRLEGGQGLARAAGRPQGLGAPGAPCGALLAQARDCVGGPLVLRRGEGPLPVLLERPPRPERGPLAPGVDLQGPAVPLGRAAAPAAPHLDVAHLDAQIRAPLAVAPGRQFRCPVRPVQIRPRRQLRRPAHKGVPAPDALRGPL